MASGGGGHGDNNVELNLTSMIDLMSVLVSFLLLSAVWQHIAAIQSNVEARGKAATSSAKPEDDMVFVHVSPTGYRITWPGKVKARVPASLGKARDGYPLDGLRKAVETAVGSQQGLKGGVSGDDRVEYGVIAETIDHMRQGGIESVGLVVN